MTVKSTVLFDQPQKAIAALIRGKIADCTRASFVAGFATVEGVEAIAAPLRVVPSKLARFVVGAATYQAFDAIDRLASLGIPIGNFFVHLGHSRKTKNTARYPFLRYHPMLHSKVYYMEMGDGQATAFVGSHNLTGFALSGLNGEASVMLEGDATSPQFAVIRSHIAESAKQASPYDPAMKEAYSWWTSQFLEGLTTKAGDAPRDGETQRTIVILAETQGALATGDKIYLEIDERLGKVGTMRAEVHVYIFSKLPASPSDALINLTNASASFWCNVVGLEDDQGGAELDADWQIDNRRAPKIVPTTRPFRPSATTGMQQVRIEVQGPLFGSFEYLFEAGKRKWEPIFDTEAAIRAAPEERETMERLRLVPREDWDWFHVKGLQAVDQEGSAGFKEALRESSPQSGSFVVVSLRRRKR